MDFNAGSLNNPKHLAWIKTCDWAMLPPEIKYDLDVTLSTPGFSHTFWAHMLKRNRGTVREYRAKLGTSLQAEAVANWNSITREDARTLAQMRRDETHLPVVCRMHMVGDIKDGMTWKVAAEIYRVTLKTVCHVVRLPTGTTLPIWFRGMIPGM